MNVKDALRQMKKPSYNYFDDIAMIVFLLTILVCGIVGAVAKALS